MKILVIEDSENHLADARTYSATLTGCVVDFATTLAEAMALLEKNNYDGVISDVFFPAEAGASAETFENAIAISIKLVELGIHHVFNTSGNHHGRKYQGFSWKTPKAIHHSSEYYFLTTGMVIEAYPDDKDPDADNGTKQWQAAFRYILLVQALLQLPDKGESVISECLDPPIPEAGKKGYPLLEGFPYGDYGSLTKRFEKCSVPFVVETFQKYNA